jgi:hypothetical protein
VRLLARLAVCALASQASAAPAAACVVFQERPPHPAKLWTDVGEVYTHHPVDPVLMPWNQLKPISYVVVDIRAIETVSRVDKLSVDLVTTWAGAPIKTTTILWPRHYDASAASQWLVIGGRYLFAVTWQPQYWLSRRGGSDIEAERNLWRQFPSVLQNSSSCGEFVAGVMRLPVSSEFVAQPGFANGFYDFLVREGVLP